MKLKTSIALTGFVAAFALLALTPAGASLVNTNNADSPVLFGMAELVHKNGDGDIVSSQTVHNRLLNTGEQILIDNAFTIPDATKNPSIICVTDNTVTITDDTDLPAEEALLAADFTPATTFAATAKNTCVTAGIDTTTTPSTAVMTATFYGSANATTPNVETDATIEHIVICNDSVAGTVRTNCAAAGEAFSAVGVGDTEVGENDSVEVTYTFDLTSDSN